MLHIFSLISLVTKFHLSEAAGLTGSAYATWFYQQYNSQNFQTIYNLFSQQTQLVFPYANFSADLQTMYNTHGTIMFNMEVQSPDPSTYSQNVIYSKTLATGSFSALSEDGTVVGAFLFALPNTSVVEMVQNFRNKMSFIFIQDGKTIVNINPTKQLSLGSSIVIPILIEYSNQIAAKILKAAQPVRRSDLAKYYLGPSDVGYATLAFSASGTITLGALMQSIYMNPSLAALEYAIDLLTLTKVQNTARSLGITSTILYPVSLRVVLGNPKNLTEVDYLNTVSKISAASLLSQVGSTHTALKKAAPAAQTLLIQAMAGLTLDYVGAYIANLDQRGLLSQYVIAMSNIAQSKFTIKGGQTAAKIVPIYQTFQTGFFKGATIPKNLQKTMRYDSVRGFVNTGSLNNCNVVLLSTFIFNSGQPNKYFTIGLAINGISQQDADIFNQLSSLIIPLNLAISSAVRQQLVKLKLR